PPPQGSLSLRSAPADGLVRLRAGSARAEAIPARPVPHGGIVGAVARRAVGRGRTIAVVDAGVLAAVTIEAGHPVEAPAPGIDRRRAEEASPAVRVRVAVALNADVAQAGVGVAEALPLAAAHLGRRRAVGVRGAGVVRAQLVRAALADGACRLRAVGV